MLMLRLIFLIVPAEFKLDTYLLPQLYISTEICLKIELQQVCLGMDSSSERHLKTSFRKDISCLESKQLAAGGSAVCATSAGTGMAAGHPSGGSAAPSASLGLLPASQCLCALGLLALCCSFGFPCGFWIGFWLGRVHLCLLVT